MPLITSRDILFEEEKSGERGLEEGFCDHIGHQVQPVTVDTDPTLILQKEKATKS